MKKLLLPLLLLWSTSVWAGTQYYLDPTCTYHGNGQASTCAASAGASGAYKNGFTLSGTGADLAIYAGTTTSAQRIYVSATGTSGDHVTINSYNKGYVGLANPILDGATTQSSSGWSLVSGAVYKATNTSTQQIRVLTVDGVRLKSVYWVSTDSEATNVARMTAGSHMTDTVGQKVYVWTSDSSTPADNLVEYSVSQGDVYYGIMDTRYADVSYVDVSNITFKRGQNFNLMLGIGTGSCTNCTVTNVTSTMSGSRGITVAGNNPNISNNTCSDAGSEKDNADPTLVDMACIVTEASAGESNTGGIVSYNSVSNMRYGSCYEINAAGINSSLDGTYFHHNRGTQCRSGLEVYGCYSASGTCTGPVNTRVDKNFFSYTGHIPIGSGYGHCTGTGNGSSHTLYTNNICVDFPASGIGTNNGRIPSQAGHHITVLNNTIYAPTTAIGTGALMSAGTSGHYGGNVFKNNVIVQASGNAVSTVADGVEDDVFDKNIYRGATTWKYNGTTYNSLTNYKNGYTTATGLTDSSINSDPLINTSNYSLGTGSPGLMFGEETNQVTDDYYDNPRIGSNDVGAVQTSEPANSVTIITADFSGDIQ